MTAPDLPPLSRAADAVALLTVRLSEPRIEDCDLDMMRQALLAITADVTAWPAILWLVDVNLHLLGSLTDDVPAAIRNIAVAVA